MTLLFLTHLLFYTQVTYLPFLEDIHCRSTVVAYVTVADTDFEANSEGTQISGAVCRITRPVKGSSNRGDYIYVITPQCLRAGSSYLLFLSEPLENQLTAFATRSVSLQPPRSAHLFTLLFAGELNARTLIFTADDVVFPNSLVRAETILALRAKRKPYLVDRSRFDTVLAQVQCPKR